MEIKTEIRYLILCCYLNFNLAYEIKITTNYKISYCGFKFDQKFTYRVLFIGGNLMLFTKVRFSELRQV